MINIWDYYSRPHIIVMVPVLLTDAFTLRGYPLSTFCPSQTLDRLLPIQISKEIICKAVCRVIESPFLVN